MRSISPSFGRVSNMMVQEITSSFDLYNHIVSVGRLLCTAVLIYDSRVSSRGSQTNCRDITHL